MGRGVKRVVEVKKGRQRERGGGREGKGREGKGREGKGREGKGREGK
jgi:hypothetical protein